MKAVLNPRSHRRPVACSSASRGFRSTVSSDRQIRMKIFRVLPAWGFKLGTRLTIYNAKAARFGFPLHLRIFALIALLASVQGCIRIPSGEVARKGMMYLVWEKASRKGPSPGAYLANSRKAFRAVEEGNLYSLQRIMASGLAWEITDERGQGLVEAAVIARKEEILEYLLQRNVPMIGADAFMYAMENEEKSILNLLLEYEVDLNQRTREGMTPLIASIMLGDPDLVRLLVEHGAEPDYPAANDERPLDFAARKTNKLGFPDADFNYAEIERILER